MASLMPNGKQQYFDNNGDPLVGGKIYTCEVGTATPKATYNSPAGDVENTNPIILNARGEASVFWDGPYKISVHDASDSLIYTVDNYIDSADQLAIDLAASTGASMVGHDSTTLDLILKNSLGKVVSSIADLKTIDKTKYTQAFVTGYYADGDGGGGSYYYDASDTTAVDNGGTVIVASDGGRWKLSHTGSVTLKQFGCVGDGVADDTIRGQAAFTWALEQTYAAIRVSEGGYLFTQINMPWSANQKLDIIGEGGIIAHQGAQALFNFTGSPRDLNVRDLTILSSTLKTDSTHAAFYFPSGITKSSFKNLKYEGLSAATWGASFFYSAPSSTVDEVEFHQNIIECNGIGYNIGKGSSVWFVGGRVKGAYNSATSYDSEGVRLCGDNGGVFSYGTDFINHKYGWRNTELNGLSNREVFFAQNCFDGCFVGLSVEDAFSYTSVVGIWAASCHDACVAFSAAGDLAVLNIAGGNIFNAGVGTPGSGYGIVHTNKGRIQCTGVIFRENNFQAFAAINTNAGVYSQVSDCQFYDNGSALPNSAQVALVGRIIFKNNYINTSAYGVPGVIRDSGSSSLMKIEGNIGYGGFGIVTPPATPASGGSLTNTTGLTATVYITGGSVNIIAVNSQNVVTYSPNAVANNTVTLKPGDTMAIAYSSVPTLLWYFH